MNRAMIDRVASRYIKESSASDREKLRWAVGEINDAVQKLDDVNRFLTARDPGDGYEGRGSLADDDGEVARALKAMNDASRDLDKIAGMLQSRLTSMGRS